MRAEIKIAPGSRFTKPAVVTLMLGLWLALLGLSASQKLHTCLHSDATHPEHDCLVTSIAKGTALDGVLPPAVVPPAAEILLLSTPEPCQSFARIDLRLLPGRAPPASVVLL